MRGLGSMRIAGVRTLVVATLLGDTALGIVDVAVIAFAAERATWLSSANAAGIAAGGFVAGVLVEGPGTDSAFLTGAVLAALAALLVLARA